MPPSAKGLILETNLTAAALLGVARDALVRQSFSGLPVPAVSTAPASTPTAKKAKYMMAAGCCTDFEIIGGSVKLTACLLLSPINTSTKSKMMMKMILDRSFAFISPFLAP